ELAEAFRVVVAGDDDAILSSSWDGGDEIRHRQASGRVFLHPLLFARRQPDGSELVLDVFARLLDCRRTRWPRPGGHELSQMAPGAVRVELHGGCRLSEAREHEQ